MADNNQVIGATLKVDASSTVAASKSISDMKANVKDLKKNFEDAAQGSAEQAEAFKKLTAAQDELKNSTANLNKTSEETTGHFKNIKEGISGLPGPLGAAGEGVNKLNSTFVKLLANPVVLIIGAIVAVLALLYKAFTNTFEGGEKMEQVFAGIKAAGQALLDNLGHIGSAILKFFTFDFSGAVKEIKGVVAAVADAGSKMAGLTKQAQELAREQAINDLDQAKRQGKLADLRAQAYDDSIPIAKRKAALKELKAESEVNAKEDMDLARRVADNRIAQLTVEEDGARKHAIEIAKIQADQVRDATTNSNELKQIGRQISSADKAETAERKAAQAKAAEEAKKIREQNQAFEAQLSKLQHENALAGITDAYAKEKQMLENKLADEQSTLQKDFANKKLTRDQYNKLETAQQESSVIQRQGLVDKHNKDVADKEAAFQKELTSIRLKTQADGLIDERAAAKVQLDITYQQQLADAIKNYKDDAVKFQAIKQALDAQLKAAQEKLDKKNKLDDDKKKLAVEEEQKKVIIENKKKTYDERIQAANDEQALVQTAFDNKVISELDYNTKVAALSQARQDIHEQEKKHNEQVTSAIGDAFNTLSELAGKQTAVGKALAIASTTIKTFQSAIAAFEGMVSEIPGPVGIALGVVAAAGAVATGIAAVKKIVAVDIPGQGAGGPVPTSPEIMSAPVAPTQKSTSLDPNSINQIGNATSGRTYVLSGDVANASDRDARLNRAAVLGGG